MGCTTEFSEHSLPFSLKPVQGQYTTVSSNTGLHSGSSQKLVVYHLSGGKERHDGQTRDASSTGLGHCRTLRHVSYPGSIFTVKRYGIPVVGFTLVKVFVLYQRISHKLYQVYIHTILYRSHLLVD